LEEDAQASHVSAEASEAAEDWLKAHPGQVSAVHTERALARLQQRRDCREGGVAAAHKVDFNFVDARLRGR
jgi:hypothetical protein